METNYAPLLADLFLHSYEAQSFNYKFRYIDGDLSLHSKNFSNFLHQIYPVELIVKDTTDSPNSASYLDLLPRT